MKSHKTLFEFLKKPRLLTAFLQRLNYCLDSTFRQVLGTEIVQFHLRSNDLTALAGQKCMPTLIMLIVGIVCDFFLYYFCDGLCRFFKCSHV